MCRQALQSAGLNPTTVANPQKSLIPHCNITWEGLELIKPLTRPEQELLSTWDWFYTRAADWQNRSVDERRTYLRIVAGLEQLLLDLGVL